MHTLKLNIFSLAVICSLCSQPLAAQFNLKAGYNISLVTDKGVNSVIDQFNSTQSYTRSFCHLTWAHGLEAGLRFKADVHAFELGYQGAYQVIKAKGETNGGAETYTDKLRFSINSASFGYNVTGDVFGMGADVQYQWYQTRAELTGRNQDLNRLQKMWAMKFYLQFTLHGQNAIDAVLQPYYVLPFEYYDLQPLSEYLNQEPGPAGDKWTRIGLSMLFYNGRK